MRLSFVIALVALALAAGFLGGKTWGEHLAFEQERQHLLVCHNYWYEQSMEAAKSLNTEQSQRAATVAVSCYMAGLLFLGHSLP